MIKEKNFFSKYSDKIVEWYNSLGIISKLIVCIVGVCILAFLVWLLSGVKLTYSIIDYNSENIESMISNSSECKDRLVFVQSEEIIGDLIDTYYGNRYINEEKVELEDYYEYAIYSEYKYKLSKSEFKRNIKNISKQFYNLYNAESVDSLEDTSIIEDIYTYSEEYGMYIIKLNLGENEHYIGLKISSTTDKFEIFYVI